MSIKKIALSGWNLVGKNLPAILTGVGVAGVVATAFLAGKGALEADKKLKEYEEEMENAGRLDLAVDKKERFKVVYKYYIPATIAGVVAAGAIIGANRVSAKQLAAIATVAKTTEKALIENREKVKELFGDKGLRKVDEKINEAHADRYFSNTDNVYETGHGKILCCDGFLTGTLFHASPEWIHKCVNDFNARLLEGEHLCYNDFIMTLIPSFDEDLLPDAGYKFSYNIDIRKRMLEIVEDSGLIGDTREPYFIFNLREMPLLDHQAYYQDHLAYA